jgi:hypothetical protein
MGRYAPQLSSTAALFRKSLSSGAEAKRTIDVEILCAGNADRVTNVRKVAVGSLSTWLRYFFRNYNSL